MFSKFTICNLILRTIILTGMLLSDQVLASKSELVYENRPFSFYHLKRESNIDDSISFECQRRLQEFHQGIISIEDIDVEKISKDLLEASAPVDKLEFSDYDPRLIYIKNINKKGIIGLFILEKKFGAIKTTLKIVRGITDPGIDSRVILDFLKSQNSQCIEYNLVDLSKLDFPLIVKARTLSETNVQIHIDSNESYLY